MQVILTAGPAVAAVIALNRRGEYAQAMPGPRISICIPTYNGMPYLPLTVDSVLRQTEQNFEIIIVDDCSTDGTAAYLSTLADLRIRVIRNETNLGVAASWTKSLDAATAPYLKLLCHDDLLHPTCLAEQAGVLDREADVVLCTCWRDLINADGRVLMTRRPLRQRLIDGPRIIRSMVTQGTNMIGEPSAGLFRREGWAEGRPYEDDNLYMIDVSLWVRLLRHGKLAVIQKPLCSFRIITTSLSAKLAKRQGHDARRFFRAVAKEHRIGFARTATGQVLATLRGIARQMIFAVQRR